MTWKTIPPHLKKYVVKQEYGRYSAVDHACWRFIIRISEAYFKDTAHTAYLNGLNAFGIGTERIPRIQEMDEKLSTFGWGAVCVRGFIPPAAFMELQSLGILAIAADIRSLEHLTYTPAPDIVHEAAGHAPIIADPDYAAYLKNYGEVASKAISSNEDMQLYLAIRDLSDVKENPTSTSEDIRHAEENLETAANNISYVSETAYMSRMNWWTVEYGLIGSPENPKIYGAGLLSSVSESFNCLTEKVKKLPFTLDCLNFAYDITEPQPQLFVTPNFQTLSVILEEFADTLAFRTGGVEGLKKAKQARTVTTAVMDTGIRMSGILENVIVDNAGNPAYLQFTGPVQICTETGQINGHGGDYHIEGYGTPVGRIAEISNHTGISVEELSPEPGAELTILYTSGVRVQGELNKVKREKDQVILLTFIRCTVTLGDHILFKPEWGLYDLAVGKQIVSVHGGPADWPAFAPFIRDHEPKNQPAEFSSGIAGNQQMQFDLYQQVRDMRESDKTDTNMLYHIYQKMTNLYPDDWLLNMEILEIISAISPPPAWMTDLKMALETRSQGGSDLALTIRRGLKLIRQP